MNTNAMMKLIICDAFDCLAVTKSAFNGISPRNMPQGTQMTANTTLRMIDKVVASIMF